ncbi:ComEA family DNA-binding protein [Candidatus Gottesmanbacteria bacterium]|nr:ComEA family DNA-binding protein [Candidatus Gottesmanbacteria bacterium]
MQINEKIKEKIKEKTEFEDPEKEEQIINIEKIQDLLSFYKIPLIFALLGVFLLGGAVVLWQSQRQTARITFTQEATESAMIKADIEGAIVNPGVYQLLSGSRIQDLLIVAGGLAGDADREWVNKNLNLAAKVLDGGKIYVPKTGEIGELGGLGSEKITGKISLNSASPSELDTLPGVGPVTAQKIIDNRPYQTTEELLSKKIVGKSTFEKIKDKISTY